MTIIHLGYITTHFVSTMQALLQRGYAQDDATKRAYNTADSMLKARDVNKI